MKRVVLAVSVTIDETASHAVTSQLLKDEILHVLPVHDPEEPVDYGIRKVEIVETAEDHGA